MSEPHIVKTEEVREAYVMARESVNEEWDNATETPNYAPLPWSPSEEEPVNIKTARIFQPFVASAPHDRLDVAREADRMAAREGLAVTSPPRLIGEEPGSDHGLPDGMSMRVYEFSVTVPVGGE